MVEIAPALMPQLKSDLARLVTIPSISVPGYPESTRPSLLEAESELTELPAEIQLFT